MKTAIIKYSTVYLGILLSVGCSRAGSADLAAADAALVGLDSKAFFKDFDQLQSNPQLTAIQQKIDATGILEDFHRSLAAASDAPIKIDGIVIRGIKSKLALQESYYQDLDRQYGTIGNLRTKTGGALHRLSAADFSNAVRGMKAAFAPASLALDDATCNASYDYGCDAAGNAFDAVGKLLPQSGLALNGSWQRTDTGTYMQTRDLHVGGGTDAVPDLGAAAKVCHVVARAVKLSTNGCDGAKLAARDANEGAQARFTGSQVSAIGVHNDCTAPGVTCFNGVSSASVNTLNSNGSTANVSMPK